MNISCQYIYLFKTEFKTLYLLNLRPSRKLRHHNFLHVLEWLMGIPNDCKKGLCSLAI